MPEATPLTWLLVLLLSVGINMVPALMPPTWLLLAFFHLDAGLAILPLALVGALGATTGRCLLALLSRSLGDRIVPRRWRDNIRFLAEEIGRNRALSLSTLGLFALGPFPSNQLFIAAGISRAPLLPILGVFLVARFLSYLLWIGSAQVAVGSLGEALGPRLGGWGVVATQLVGFAILVLVMRVDWSKHFGHGIPNRLPRPGQKAPETEGTEAEHLSDFPGPTP